jgi:hypothetical protein
MWIKKTEENTVKSKKRKCTKRHYKSSSDEEINAHKSNSPIKMKETNEDSDEFDDLKVILALYQDHNKKPVEKWDHAGFEELYGSNLAHNSKPSTSSTSISQSANLKNEHDSSRKSRTKRKRHKKKKKKKSEKRSHLSTSMSSSSSDRKTSHHKHKKKKF